MKLCQAVLFSALLLYEVSPVIVQQSKLTDVVLKALDLKHTPRTSKEKFHVPRYIMALYSRRVRTDRLRRDNREVIRTFFREGQHEPVGSHYHFLFNVSAIKPEEKIKRAELQIFKRKPKADRRPRGSSFLVSVALLTRRWNPDVADVLVQQGMEVISSEVVQNNRKGEWITFDVASSVTQWKNRPVNNFGLVVSIHGMGVNSSSFEMGKNGRREPFLVTFSTAKKTPETPQKEKKTAVFDEASRAAADEDIANETRSSVIGRRTARSVQARHCRKRPLKVHFKHLNWKKWIIEPRSYSAYYCHGRCPVLLHDYFNPTNHAILQNILHHRVDRSIPCASCVPTKLHSISVLFYNDDKTVSLRLIGGMVVSTCGCL